MATAYIALGSNLRDRVTTLRAAIERLRELGEVKAISPLYETAPVGYADQPPYLNAVARLRTDLDPEALLSALLAVEADLGRVRSFPNAPRTLDLDLLFYDDRVLDTPTLTLPHPRLHERAFVLVPLADIAPDVVHPRLGQAVEALLVELGPVSGVRAWPADTERGWRWSTRTPLPPSPSSRRGGTDAAPNAE